MQEPSLIALHGARGAGKDTTFDFITKWCAKSDPALSAVRRGFADHMKWAYMRMWVPDIGMTEAIKFIDKWKDDPEAVCTGIFMDPEDGAVINSDTAKAAKLHTEFNWDEDGKLLTFIPPVNFRDHMNQFATESARSVYGDDHWVDMLLPLHPTDRNPEGWRGHFLVPPRSAEDDPYSFAHFAVITDLRALNEMVRVRVHGGLLVKIRRRDAEDKQRAYYEAKGIDPHLFSQELDDDLFDVIINNDDNDMDKAYLRTYHMMNEIRRNGIASIQAGRPRPWRLG